MLVLAVSSQAPPLGLSWGIWAWDCTNNHFWWYPYSDDGQFYHCAQCYQVLGKLQNRKRYILIWADICWSRHFICKFRRCVMSWSYTKCCAKIIARIQQLMHGSNVRKLPCNKQALSLSEIRKQWECSGIQLIQVNHWSRMLTSLFNKNARFSNLWSKLMRNWKRNWNPICTKL